MRWLELSTTDKDQVSKILADMQVHPLVIEDCLHQGQRAKIEEYENHQFLVWFALIETKIYELQFVIFPDSLVLVTHEPPPGSSTTWQDFLKGDINRSKDTPHLLYQILDNATDRTMAELRSLSDKIQDFEDAMFESSVDPRSILNLGKILSRSDFSIGHLPSVTKQMQNIYQFKDDLKWKLRDLHDHCERIKNWIDSQGMHITNAIDLYWGLEANRTNLQVKKLSLLASITLPLTFWTSFFGMNFHFIPYESSSFFELAIAIMMLSSLAVYFFLRRRGLW